MIHIKRYFAGMLFVILFIACLIGVAVTLAFLVTIPILGVIGSTIWNAISIVFVVALLGSLVTVIPYFVGKDLIK